MSAIDQLFDTQDGDELSFAVLDEVFAAFSVAGAPAGCGGVFRAETLATRSFAVLSRARRKLVGTARLAVKLVGPAEKLAPCRQALERANVTILSATATVKRAEIRYYPGQSRVRVATAAIAAAVAAEAAPRRLKVAIVDDSKTIRLLLRNILSASGDVDILWEAGLPSEALRHLETARPDVLTLDLHMPEMNGVKLLEAYIDKHPIPTVVISSLSKDESPLVFEALERGAIDYIQKPSAKDLSDVSALIVEKVKAAAHARVIRAPKARAAVARLAAPRAAARDLVIAIGASTGGTEALRELLLRLPPEIPPIVIVQHIPPVFSLAFANRLNALCPFEVKEAEHGDAVVPNRVLIAPGGRHMALEGFGATRRVAILDTDPVNRHRPSVDVLFDSAAKLLGAKAIGVILTGMGGDGAQGLLRMKEAGARTFAQDEASCVVFGMPKEAIRLGAAQRILALTDIPQALLG